MSDYFDSLIRSSGLTVGSSMPTRLAPPVSRPSLVEIDIQHSVPVTQPLPASSSQPATLPKAGAIANEAPASQREFDPPPARPMAAISQARALADGPLASDGHAAGVHLRTQQAEPPIPSVAPAAPVPPPQAHALVRAAMQWVAADPQQASPEPWASAPRERFVAPTEPARPHAVISTPVAKAEAGPQSAPPAQVQPLAHPLAPGEDTPRRPGTPATPLAAPVTASPSPRDELFEISIGAIHLRVEAPTPQTVARVPPPPSAAQRAAGPTITPRSALSRRALRRI